MLIFQLFLYGLFIVMFLCGFEFDFIILLLFSFINKLLAVLSYRSINYF